jgi:hypothetical protein
MSKIKEIEEGRERWPKGVDIRTTIKEIDEYVKFKTTKYAYHNFQDDEL